MKKVIVAMIVLCACAAIPAAAQQTTGNIQGRITDNQKAAVPGVTVTAKNNETGFVRSEVTDAEGIYRLNALPVGTYDLHAELAGFAPYERKALPVSVAQTLDLNIDLTVAGVSESVSVTAESPLIQTSSSSVGGVVDVQRIENLPLNGRQFANAAIAIPGVGLGYHSDPTKSTQFSPQIAGGNGRNVNYQIDGGDNNDDTVGGLLQLFPLEAIQEFNFVTQRYKAEYGRSNGGVMNIVTKSGTNDVRGSWFTLLRDSVLNARTETEKLSDVPKQDYRRWQYGGSFGGPVIKDKVHYFGAFERTQQDTFQAVDTQGLFPNLDGVYTTPYRENLLTVKGTANLNTAQYLSVRYGRNTNSQPYGAGPLSPPDNWGVSGNTFNSINLNHNWVLGGAKLNEFIFQYASFANNISANSLDPNLTFPNGVSIGQNGNTPQTTEQQKWQFRDDFSWSVSGMGGLSHGLKAGVNFINEPRLFITFNTGTGDYAYTMLTNDQNGLVTDVTLNGGSADANIPTKQYAAYIQDDWKVTNKLTLNLGFRYDLLNGYAIDQHLNPNYVKITNAAKAGRFAGQPAFDDFSKSPAEDKNNWQPRAGAVYDLRGDGRDVLRAGWGRYYDVGYTNANILFAAVNATGIGAGQVFNVHNVDGIIKNDGQPFHVGDDPATTIASQNEAGGALPLNSHVASPRITQPYSNQTSAGWSHEINSSTVFDVDYVHSDGHDLGWRIQLNQVNPGGTGRQFADLGTSPANFTIDITNGRSRYNGVNFGLRRRMTAGLSFNAWYSLSDAKSTTGNGSDELNIQNIQNHLDPFADVQMGPSGRTDARHRVSILAVWNGPWGITVSPVWRFRSALPVGITQGIDLNGNTANNEISTEAFGYDGLNGDGTVKLKDLGACTTINCGRGASQQAFNLRVSKGFRLVGSTRIEAIGEIFNLFNAKNPATFTTRRYLGSTTAPNADFMRPQEYSGDFQNPEQRVGQIGFRFTF
jgi:outer membrane receptor protein involved in Fe transport